MDKRTSSTDSLNFSKDFYHFRREKQKENQMQKS